MRRTAYKKFDANPDGTAVAVDLEEVWIWRPDARGFGRFADPPTILRGVAGITCVAIDFDNRLEEFYLLDRVRSQVLAIDFRSSRVRIVSSLTRRHLDCLAVVNGRLVTLRRLGDGLEVEFRGEDGSVSESLCLPLSVSEADLCIPQSDRKGGLVLMCDEDCYHVSLQGQKSQMSSMMYEGEMHLDLQTLVSYDGSVLNVVIPDESELVILDSAGTALYSYTDMKLRHLATSDLQIAGKFVDL
jgi:hypothetical protein